MHKKGTPEIKSLGANYKNADVGMFFKEFGINCKRNG